MVRGVWAERHRVPQATAVSLSSQGRHAPAGGGRGRRGSLSPLLCGGGPATEFGRGLLARAQAWPRWGLSVPRVDDLPSFCILCDRTCPLLQGPECPLPV